MLWNLVHRADRQVLLELWSTASDSVRIASFLAVRKAFVAGDDALKDLCLKVSALSCQEEFY